MQTRFCVKPIIYTLETFYWYVLYILVSFPFALPKNSFALWCSGFHRVLFIFLCF